MSQISEIDLGPDEGVLWESTNTPMRSIGHAPKWWHKLVTPLFWVIILGLQVWSIYLNGWPETDVLAKYVLFFVVLFLVSRVARNYAPPWFRQFTRQRVFSRCVITTQRILLSRSADSEPVALDRTKLTRAEPDFIQGSQGLAFRTSTSRDRYAYIGLDNLSGAIRALKGTPS